MFTLLKLYQLTAPFRNSVLLTLGISPHACRHQPSCSVYAQQMLKKYGTISGSYLALRRFFSCHPFSNN